MEFLISVDIPDWRRVPGDRARSYRQIVEWPALPSKGDTIHVGNVFTTVDEVRFRSDGKPEIHVKRFPEFSEPETLMANLAVLCDELLIQGYTPTTAWDEPDDEFAGPNG